MYVTYLTVTFDGYVSLRRCRCYVTWRAVPDFISIILIIFIVWTDYLITIWIILTVTHNNQRCIFNMGFIHNVELKSVNGREKSLYRRVSTCGYQSKHSDFVTHASGMSNGRYLSLSAQIPNWGGGGVPNSPRLGIWALKDYSNLKLNDPYAEYVYREQDNISNTEIAMKTDADMHKTAITNSRLWFSFR